MVPYIHVPDIPIGPITIHPFGILVATGVVIGTLLTLKRARARGVDTDELNSFITWMLAFGFILSHALDEIFYHPQHVLENPLTLLKPWEGLSSFGGFIGAFVGIMCWKYFYAEPRISLGPLGTIPSFHRRKTPRPVLPLCELIVSVFPVAWIFGRSGCSVVHDHPGALADPSFFLAVGYPPGPTTSFGPLEFIHGRTLRYDLGFLELLFTIGLSAFLVATWHRKLPTGVYLTTVSLAYAPVRFVMDFFRIAEGNSADARYASLTPAQYSCIGLFAVGLLLLVYTVRTAKSGVDPLDVYRTPKPEPGGLASAAAT